MRYFNNERLFVNMPGSTIEPFTYAGGKWSTSSGGGVVGSARGGGGVATKGARARRGKVKKPMLPSVVTAASLLHSNATLSDDAQTSGQLTPTELAMLSLPKIEEDVTQLGLATAQQQHDNSGEC